MTAAALGVALLACGPNAPGAGTASIDNGGCGFLPNGGLGDETCMPADPMPGEGILFTAAEQVVSIVSAVADVVGCPAVAFAGPIPVTISDNQVFPQSATTRIGGAVNFATFDTVEQSNTRHFAGPFLSNGVRVHLTTLGVAGNFLAATLPGTGLTALTGQFNSDGPYGVLYGSADFVFNGDALDERLIKDFYLGVPVPPTFVDQAGQPAPCSPAGFEAGTCLVQDAGDYAPSAPFNVPRIIRDNGLEVTTKQHAVADLAAGGTLEASHPKGKWRQISFYRMPDGGDGRLTYTKVRIAPFGAASCALQLNGKVTGNMSFPEFDGTLRVFPL